MNPSFERLMADATRLTRAGDLKAATAAIQAALRGSAARSDDDVIDVAAREIDVAVDVDSGTAARVAPERNTMADGGRFSAGRFAHPAGTRDYKLFVPPDPRDQALPLVVMLHGCTQNPDDFAAGTRMNEAALARGFLVLYPEQAQSANPSRCWNWFKHNHQQRGRGEPALLADLTRDVMQHHRVDPRRVYVAGLSAGGAMAAILGAAYPDLFAAVGVHSGLPVGSARDAQTAFEAMRSGAASPTVAKGASPPTIVFHGDRDATVHPANAARVVAACRGTNAELERRSSPNGRTCTRHVHRDASGRVQAEHWVVHGAGHAWSGGSPRGSYTDAKGPDATTEMLRFFFENPLQADA